VWLIIVQVQQVNKLVVPHNVVLEPELAELVSISTIQCAVLLAVVTVTGYTDTVTVSKSTGIGFGSRHWRSDLTLTITSD